MKRLIFVILFAFILQTDCSYAQWILYQTGFVATSDIQFVNRNTGWAMGFNTILKTTNEGINWFPQDKNVSTPVTHCYFISANTGWIIGSYGTIIKTTNGGNNWVDKSFDDAFRYGVFFPTPDTGWAVGLPGIITKTTDGGETWFNQQNPANWYLNDVFFINSLTGWVVGEQVNPYFNGVILKTTNGGDEWFYQSSNTSFGLHAVFFINQTTGWIAGNGAKILRTTNAGDTWIVNTVGNPTGDHHFSLYFLDEMTGWVVGQHGCMYKTTDGGISWVCEPNGNYGILNSVTFAPNGYGWAVGREWNANTGVLFRYDNCVRPLFSISGSTSILVGSVNNVFTSSANNGYWDISNYGNAQASIPQNSNNDTVLVSAGNQTGHFVLYFIASYNCGGDTLLSKHVYIDNPLPVELTSFSSLISGSNVTLTWSTSAEINNYGFDIEKININDQTPDVWSKAGFVQGNGTTSSVHYYEFIDEGLNSGKYKYRLKQLDFNGNFHYYELENEVVIGIPDKYYLSQNFPNPFNPKTIINYQCSMFNFVSLRVYDILGNEVATLVNEKQRPGIYKVEFDARLVGQESGLPSGIYFYRLTAGNFTDTKRMVLIK